MLEHPSRALLGVGFEAVDDWTALRTALTARGHGVGAIHHLPLLDGSTR